MSDSVRPHRRQPIRLLHPWDFPGKSTGVGCHRLLRSYILAAANTMHTQLCPTLCDPMDCSPPGSSVHGIFQARILEWGAISSSRGSSQPTQGSNPHLSCLLHCRRILSHWVTRELVLAATIRKLERVKSIINCNNSYVMIYNIYWTLEHVSATVSIIIYKYYTIQSSSQLDNPQYRNEKSVARRNWEACPSEWRRQVLNWSQSPYSYKLYFPLCYLVDALRKLLILHRTFT